MVLTKEKNKYSQFWLASGFSLIELLVVVTLIGILISLSLPGVISMRRQLRFTGLQNTAVTHLRVARQEAISQRTPITFCYNNDTKEMSIFGGTLGTEGATTNNKISLSGDGVLSGEIIYGRPNSASTSNLSDSTNLTPLTNNKIYIAFQPDGSVLNSNGLPQNSALFFYHAKYPTGSAFAVSVLGAAGRVKLWRYNANVNTYTE